MSISLPAPAGGVSGKGGEQRPECSRHSPLPPPCHTHSEKPCVKLEPHRTPSELRRRAVSPRSSSFLRYLLMPAFSGCHQVPKSGLVCITPSFPLHCHQHKGKASRPREPSETQHDCTASPLQGNPSSWVHSNLSTIPPPARLILASLYSMLHSKTIILLLGGGTLPWARGILSRVAPQGFPPKPGPWNL